MGEIEELRTVVAGLQARLDVLEGRTEAGESGPPGDTGTAGDSRRLSRRGLLAAAVAGGAGLVAQQVTTAAPAAAAPGGAIVMGAANDAGTTATTVTSAPSLHTPVFTAECTNGGFGISGRSGSGWGVDARSSSGVGLSAQSSSGTAVSAYTATGGFAVYSVAVQGTGVYGQSQGAYPGVYGVSDISGPGVRGISEYGHGVHGHSARGVAVRAEAGTDETGQSPGPGTDAVHATAVNGYGVHAAGGVAPLRLVPTTTRGRPESGAHQRGELVVDSLGALFLCTKGGTPGVWRQVTVS